MNALNWEGASGRRLSAVTLTGLVLALAAGALALAAALGYRTGALDLGTSFSFLRWGARGGVAALVVSVAGLVLTVVRGRGRSLDDLVPGAAAGRTGDPHRRSLLRHSGRPAVDRARLAAHS